MTSKPEPDQQSGQKPVPSAELSSFMAELNATLKKGGKKKEPSETEIRKDLNRKWHEKNQPLDATRGKAPERLNPEESTHWVAEAKETHVTRQCCKCCGDHVDFIGGEFVRFKSIMPFGGYVWRRLEHVADVWNYTDLTEETRWHSQDVARCVGCMQVEQQAVEIWEQAKKQVTPEPQQDLPFTINLGE